MELYHQKIKINKYSNSSKSFLSSDSSLIMHYFLTHLFLLNPEFFLKKSTLGQWAFMAWDDLLLTFRPLCLG